MLFVAVMLFASSTANAACCCFEDSAPEMQMEMPCHDADKVSKTSTDSNSCDDCDCQSCLKTIGLIESDNATNLSVNAVLMIELIGIYSHINNSIYSPPKHIS